MEDDSWADEDTQPDIHELDRQDEQHGERQGQEIKVEADRNGQHGHERPYEESRSCSYYEHREEKRYAHPKSTTFSVWYTPALTLHHCRRREMSFE